MKTILIKSIAIALLLITFIIPVQAGGKWREHSSYISGDCEIIMVEKCVKRFWPGGCEVGTYREVKTGLHGDCDPGNPNE